MKINLHTHTFHCRHAVGKVEDYCREAEKAGISILGFSDHGPFPDAEYHPDRMFYREMPDYVREIEEAKRKFPEITLLKALEMDYRPCLGKAFYEDEYFGKFGLDYLIGGAHYIPAAGGLSARSPGFMSPMPEELVKGFMKSAVDTMETGLIEYLTHPDIVAMSCPVWTPNLKSIFREVIDASIALDIPLEINAYGMRKPPIETPSGKRQPYPWHPFWEMAAEANVKAVIGTDAHRPEDVWGNYDEAKRFADELGIKIRNEEVAKKILARKSGK